jgi:hypothetical protein
MGSLYQTYLKALDDGWTHAGVSKRSGVPPASLRKYVETQSLGPEYRARLRQWLVERQYSEPEETDPWREPVARLQGLLAVLEGNRPDARKRTALQFELEFLAGWLKKKS